VYALYIPLYNEVKRNPFQFRCSIRQAEPKVNYDRWKATFNTLIDAAMLHHSISTMVRFGVKMQMTSITYSQLSQGCYVLGQVNEFIENQFRRNWSMCYILGIGYHSSIPLFWDRSVNGWCTTYCCKVLRIFLLKHKLIDEISFSGRQLHQSSLHNWCAIALCLTYHSFSGCAYMQKNMEKTDQWRLRKLLQLRTQESLCVCERERQR